MSWEASLQLHNKITAEKFGIVSDWSAVVFFCKECTSSQRFTNCGSVSAVWCTINNLFTVVRMKGHVKYVSSMIVAVCFASAPLAKSTPLPKKTPYALHRGKLSLDTTSTYKQNSDVIIKIHTKFPRVFKPWFPNRGSRLLAEQKRLK